MAAMASAAQTMVSVDFPDGSIVSYDRVRRQLILTLSNGSVISAGGALPARPNPPTVVTNAAGEVVVAEDMVLEPVSCSAIVQKLGYKKAPIIGSDIWNKRYIHLEARTLTYHENERSAPKGSITLVPGCEVDIIQAEDPALKDRQEGGHNPGVMKALTANIGTFIEKRSGPLGKPNLLELHVPADVGNTLGAVMGASALSLAMSGASEIKKNMARTYYFSFDSLEEAEEFAGAIKNNVKVLQKENQLGNKPVDGNAIRAGNFSQLNNAMHMAQAMQQNMQLMTKSETSLEYYRNALNTSLPSEVVYERLVLFYDTLASMNIHPSYR